MNQEEALKRWRDTYQKAPKQASNRRKKKLEGLEKMYMEQIMRKTGWPWEPELKFDTVRKFRFDYADPSRKIAVEYEGIGGGGQSRHTSIIGYTNDCKKYTLAAILGWRVLRYTVKNYADLEADLAQIADQEKT